MSLLSLAGKKGLIVGLANEHSIAYGFAQMAKQQGAHIVATCLNDKARRFVEPLTQALDITLHTCDVEQEGALEQLIDATVAELGTLDFVLHSIAWAPLTDLHGKTIHSSPEGFARAMNISVPSLVRFVPSPAV